MKRKTMALMLALSMCLSLLSACGSGGTATDDKPPESENAVSSTEQQPVESEKPEESEKPKEEEPEESAEPTQEEPKEENNAGTALLALLQEEYKNGFVTGERPGGNYELGGQSSFAFISNGVVYVGWDLELLGHGKLFSYDIASKKLSEIEIEYPADEWGNLFPLRPMFMRNNTIYCQSSSGEEVELYAYDFNGVCRKTIGWDSYQAFYGNMGILLPKSVDGILIYRLSSYDLEKIAEIPAPQREGPHGVKEDVNLDFGSMFAADGTVYARANNGNNSEWYRLNTDTYEWEKNERTQNTSSVDDFCGKYAADGDGIYDRVTGEKVFEYGELYRPNTDYGGLSYFGGDQYLGDKNGEFRWVNLTDLSMSDPLPFPENDPKDSNYITDKIILNDTYCVYKDKYGWFLWNYNTGEEETIVMFER